jgi:hypothetical protein
VKTWEERIQEMIESIRKERSKLLGFPLCEDRGISLLCMDELVRALEKFRQAQELRLNNLQFFTPPGEDLKEGDTVTVKDETTGFEVDTKVAHIDDYEVRLHPEGPAAFNHPPVDAGSLDKEAREKMERMAVDEAKRAQEEEEVIVRQSVDISGFGFFRTVHTEKSLPDNYRLTTRETYVLGIRINISSNLKKAGLFQNFIDGVPRR